MAEYNSFLTVWAGAVGTSLTDLWFQFVSIIPNVIAALVVFFIGWSIAIGLGKLVEKLMVMLRINSAFDSITGLKRAVEQAGLKLDIAHLLGEIFKWFLIIVTLLASTDILGLNQVSQFLNAVLVYIPNVIVAAIILVISVVLANFVYRTVLASVEAAGFTSGGAIAALSKWSILVFAILAALLQLNVATQLLQTFLTAFFAMVAIAGGLAFGLGGKDLAAKWLQKAEHDLSGKRHL
ncbi:MAG: hypothetical protein O3A36_00215 [bacterium]|nr:hypothetical protein [bacterium]